MKFISGEIQEQSKIDIHNEISHCRNCNSIIKHSVVPQSKLIDEEVFVICSLLNFMRLNLYFKEVV